MIHVKQGIYTYRQLDGTERKIKTLVASLYGLYAEIGIPSGASKDYGYLTLKEIICNQARDKAIDIKELIFPLDGKEDQLSEDADGIGVKGDKSE